MVESLIINIPIAASMYAITVKFLEFYDKHREADRKIWENHLSKSIETQNRTVEILTVLSTKMDIWGIHS